ncbi:ccr4 associated factor, partial [Thoreauomyces humboldtii]
RFVASLSTSTGSSLPSSPVPASDYLRDSNSHNRFARLEDRGFVEIEGPEAVKFLQGLTTNQLSRIERGGDGIFAAFLTAQGRVLFDVFIYPKNRGETFPHPAFIIDHDARLTSDLLQHLKRYKLRAKLSITDATRNYEAHQIWGPDVAHMWGNYLPPLAPVSGVKHPAAVLPAGAQLPRERFCDVGCRDPRHTDLGLRVVLEKGTKGFLPATFQELSGESYKLRRILLGIPEGSDDFVPGTSLPLESNLDLLSGVDFRKGCYLGQELTIRTYHTGVTRKRIVPVQFTGSDDPVPTALTLDVTSQVALPAPHTDVTLDASAPIPSPPPTTPPQRVRRPPANIGRIASSSYNVGLALMRLDHLQVGDASAAKLVAGDAAVRVYPFAPDWWPQAVGGRE